MTVPVEKQQKVPEGRSRAPAPPEGGWGWMIVAGCFLASICTRAVTRCVSMFFVEFQLHFDKDYSSTAWTHSLIDCITMFCAPLGSFLANRFSCRTTMIVGGLLSSAGLVISAFASSLEFLYVSLGVMTGLGFALSYMPSIAMVGTYFNERKALAYGIALSGSGIGTFILAPVVQLLIEQYSWRGALLILGGFVSNLFVCGAVMRPLDPSGQGESERVVTNKEQEALDSRVGQHVSAESGQAEQKQLEKNDFEDNQWPLTSNGAVIDVESDHSTTGRWSRCASGPCGLDPSSEFGFLLMPDFLILSASFMFMAYGCSSPVVYLVPYALSAGVPHQHAAFLMSIFGISGIVGNITFGWITDQKSLRRFRMLSYMVAVGMAGLCCMFLPFLRSLPLLVAFSVVYGYFDGAYVALIPVVTSDTVGPNYLTSSLGVVYFLHAVPYLISPPVGGWLVDTTGDYMAMFFLCGACYLCSSVLVAATVLFRRYRQRSTCKLGVRAGQSPAAAAAQRTIL